jgi:hypothetical protein
MQESPELASVHVAIYDELSAGDFARFKAYISMSPYVLTIGTDPAEWWMGHDTVAQIFRTQIDEMGGIALSGARPLAFVEGSVGWVSDRPTIKLPDGTHIPLRITAVYHREDGQWRFVSWHASIGVANEEAFGQDLTT